jgi:MscS family membrane protein
MFQLSFIHQLPYFEDQKLLYFVGISLIGWLLTKLLIFIWEKLILPIVNKTESSLDDHLAKNLHKPITRLLSLGSVYIAAQMTIATAHQFKVFINIFENLIYLLLVLIIAGLVDAGLKSFIDWYLQDVASKTESTLDETLFPIFRKAGAIVIYFIAATVILGQFKVNLTGFLATAGIASFAIAFGSQDLISNIISGIGILLEHSYHIGERIELKDGLVGDVVEIGLRSTRIMSLDHRIIIVPNKEIAGSRLINWSQPDPAIIIKLKIGVAMDEDLGHVKKIIADVCAKENSLSQSLPPSVVCTGFGPYFIELSITAMVDNCRNSGGTIDQLVIKLQDAFKRENIRLPYPQQQISIIRESL